MSDEELLNDQEMSDELERADAITEQSNESMPEGVNEELPSEALKRLATTGEVVELPEEQD